MGGQVSSEEPISNECIEEQNTSFHDGVEGSKEDFFPHECNQSVPIHYHGDPYCMPLHPVPMYPTYMSPQIPPMVEMQQHEQYAQTYYYQPPPYPSYSGYYTYEAP